MITEDIKLHVGDLLWWGNNVVHADTRSNDPSTDWVILMHLTIDNHNVDGPHTWSCLSRHWSDGQISVLPWSERFLRRKATFIATLEED